jgi:hypothetical protein
LVYGQKFPTPMPHYYKGAKFKSLFFVRSACKNQYKFQNTVFLKNGRNSNFDWFLCKDWRLKKKTKVYSWFWIEKISEIILFFYLHFPWLYEPWQQQRILKKYPFWKHDSWFSSEVSKLTSVFYPWNDAFSGIQKWIF